MAREQRSYKSTQRTRKGAVTTFGSRTDVGCVRDHNEDSLIVTPPLFAVADGMGGHAAGEVASEIAVNVLAELAPKDLDGAALEHAVEEANHEIIRAARADEASVAIALYSGIFNLGIGPGSFLGGVVSTTLSLAAIGLVGGVLAAVGSVVCLLGLARRAR